MPSSQRWGWIGLGSRFGVAAIVSVALLALSAAGLAASAQAANYTVGTTNDLAGECLPASGTCSLRQLIEYENLNKPPEPDAIVVPSGKYDLTLGELVIEQQLVIVGAGARTTIVDEPAGTEARVFQVEAVANGGSVGIVGLEIAGGTAKGGFGGDISNAGDLVLVEDWVTGGNAAFGGGLSNDSGTLAVENSLVSGNHASSSTGEGGAIGNVGTREVKPGTLAILNSTIAANDARIGGGIFSKEDTGNQIAIEDSTIAFNRAQEESGEPASGPGAGLALSAEGGTVQVGGSIIADNTETLPGVGTTPTNCSAPEPAKIEDPYPFGYNLESGSDCGFASTGDLPNTAPGFSTGELQNNGGNTDTLALAANSPAVDAIPTSFPFCNGLDQRDVTRPQGAGCDMGAYELGGAVPPPPPPQPTPAPPTVLSVSPPTVLTTTSAAFTTTVNPNGLATTVHFEYGPVLPGASAAAITYGSVTPDQPVTPDFANHTVTATVTGLLPNITYNVRAVATNSAGSTVGANQALQTPADPPPPPPVLGKSVNVMPVSGIVYIELPPGATLASVSPLAPFAPAAQAFAALTKGRRFIPLTEARQIPVGSVLETTHGVVNITTATTASTKGKLQSGDFEAGIFKLLQKRKQKGLTELDIIDNQSAHQLCATQGKGKAHIAASHPSSKVLGRLTSTSHGHFTARGQYSAATVRGTSWGVLNQCDGTLTRVKRGVVSVRDFRRRKTITLFTGQTYLAKAPGY